MGEVSTHMKHLFKKQEGFTLLELLIVIVIIGILAVLIIPNLTTGPQRARDAQRKSDLRNMKTALETYFNDTNAYPSGDYAGLETTLEPTYIKTVPVDPRGGTNAAPGYVYTPTCAGTPSVCTSYVLDATLENSKDSAIKSGTTSTYEVSSAN
jgi:type II secretion system protein G